MSPINSSIRPQRFRFREGADLALGIQTKTGEALSARPVNCSLFGLGGLVALNADGVASLTLGDLLSGLTLRLGSETLALGRVILRTCTETPEGLYLGFSLIDSRLELETKLAPFLVPEKEGSPYSFELAPGKFSTLSFEQEESLNADLFSKCDAFSVFHQTWKKSQIYQFHTVRRPTRGVEASMHRAGDDRYRDFIVAGSYDYLGLAYHPRVVQAFKTAADLYGVGSTGTPVTTGMTEAHVNLGQGLAQALGRQSVLLTTSGYNANVSGIQALLKPQDLVVADALSHMSIHESIRSSTTAARFFRHNDLNHLEEVLKEHRGSHAGCMIVTEGLFSMDGDVPDLDGIMGLARRFQARVFVDEAHSFGVLGRRGLGVGERFSSGGTIDIVMGSLSKGLGTVGGFLAADTKVIEWLYAFSRPHVFSGSLPPAVAAAAAESVRVLREEPAILATLRRNIARFRKGLIALGWQEPTDEESPIFPVVVRSEAKLAVMNESLLADRVFVMPVIYPAVSRHRSRFRFCVSALHSESELDHVLDALKKAMLKASFSFSKT